MDITALCACWAVGISPHFGISKCIGPSIFNYDPCLEKKKSFSGVFFENARYFNKNSEII